MLPQRCRETVRTPHSITGAIPGWYPASTVGSWLIIDMDKGLTTSVFIELLMAPTEMSGDGKTGLFDLLSASTV